MPKTVVVWINSFPTVLPILFKKKCGTSQLYQEIQTTATINSCNNKGPIGSHTGTKITNVNTEGVINCVYTVVHNIIQKNTDKTCNNNPPLGSLAITFSELNKSEIPTKANEDPSWIYPPSKILFQRGIIATSECNGAYLGAVGTCERVINLNANPIYAKDTVTYVIPSQFKFTRQIIDNARLAIKNNKNTNKN
jgi:hypothetical protein